MAIDDIQKGVETRQTEEAEKRRRETIKTECAKQNNIYPLAVEILNRHEFITTEDGQDTYVYAAGVYEDANMTIQTEVELVLLEAATTHKANEVTGHVARSSMRRNAEIRMRQPWLICLQNEILNCLSGETQPHTPRIIFFNKLPVSFEASADCPKIKEFLSQIMSEQDTAKIQEYFGYCLYAGMPFHKALMLVGTGSNGKSTLIKLLQQFLGAQNCASISLQSLETNRFSPIILRDKLVNIFADLPSEAMKSTSQFKILISGDPVQGERKFKEPVIFNNTCKMIYSANQVPISYDDSDAFYRRWEIVTFPNTFSEGKENPKILDALATPTELSGLLNWALSGLKRLLAQGQFTGTKNVNELRELYLRMSDSVAAFQMDEIEASPEEIVEKAVLFKAYVSYCRTNRYPSLSENSFHRRFQKLMNVENCQPRGADGKQKHSWKGIRLSKNPLIKQDNHDFANFKSISNIYIKKEKTQLSQLSHLFNSDISFPEYASFERLEEPHGSVEGLFTACCLCGLKRCYYIHKVSKQYYCQACAGDVERGGVVAK